MIKKNNNIKVVAIGAHPDDIEFGCAMRILHHVENGDTIIGIICSDGEKGGERETRLKEAENAAKTMGIKKLYNLHFPDTNFPDMTIVKDAIEKIINKEKPSVVYTHFKEDIHQDHSVVAQASAIACRKVPNILTYKSPSTILASFHPHLFHVGSEEDFQKKENILKVHQSQIKKYAGFDLEKLRMESKFYASSINHPGFYAEPFCANHIVLNLINNDKSNGSASA